MALLSWPAKDPADITDFAIDWTDLFAEQAPADTIATVTWTVPAPLTAGIQVKTGLSCSVVISGGIHGRDYEVVCTVTTTAGRTFQRTVLLPVREQ